MLKFIVTGGTSFIGRQVVKQIVNNGDFVYVICRKESPSIKYLPNNDLVKIIYLDFNNIDGLNKIINQADIFLNLAWTGGTQKTRDDVEIQKANVRNSLNALYVAEKLGCKYFFEAGSQSELGICNCLQTEELPFNPFTEYAKGKEEVVIPLCSVLQAQRTPCQLHLFFKKYFTFRSSYHANTYA